MMRAVVISGLLVLAAAACQREERRFSLPEASPRPLTVQPASNFFAGEQPLVAADTLDPMMPGYAETAYAVSEGSGLYMAFNCVGCHANGGGAIGPALIDNVWFYGSSPYAIAQSILGGRHNGMPSFRNKLGAQQLYSLVAYVRTLGGLVRGDAIPARLDHMRTAPARNLNNAGWPFWPKETP
jgi:cytochrome c oxidase cbb3-type subunit III